MEESADGGVEHFEIVDYTLSSAWERFEDCLAEVLRAWSSSMELAGMRSTSLVDALPSLMDLELELHAYGDVRRPDGSAPLSAALRASRAWDLDGAARWFAAPDHLEIVDAHGAFLSDDAVATLLSAAAVALRSSNVRYVF